MGKCQRDNLNSHRLGLVLCFQRANSELTSVSIVAAAARVAYFAPDADAHGHLAEDGHAAGITQVNGGAFIFKLCRSLSRPNTGPPLRR